MQNVLLANVPSLTAQSHKRTGTVKGVTSFDYGTSLVRSRAKRWYYVSVAVSIRRRANVGGKIYLGSEQGTGLADHTDAQSER